MSADNKYKKVFTQSKTVAGEMVNVTYNELVGMVQNSQLTPGQKYRITDYATVYNNTQQGAFTSAGHPFDIITTALSENTLSENCSAMVNDNDTSGYFDTCNLGAWQIKYALQPGNRFMGYPETGGKGYIYQMTDDHYNTAACDFKNRLYNGYFIFTREITEGGETRYEDASLSNWCYGNTVNIDWVQYEEYHIPSCVLIATIGYASNIKNNYVTSHGLFVRANSIQSNRFYETMQSAARVRIDGATPFTLVSNCEFRINTTGSLTLQAADSSLVVKNCTFNLNNTQGNAQIATEASLINCLFNMSSTVHTINPYTWGIGTQEGVHVDVSKENDVDVVIAHKVMSSKIAISKGVWNTTTQSYDWTDKSITL